jgi:hypothetical protein
MSRPDEPLEARRHSSSRGSCEIWFIRVDLPDAGFPRIQRSSCELASHCAKGEAHIHSNVSECFTVFLI